MAPTSKPTSRPCEARKTKRLKRNSSGLWTRGSPDPVDLKQAVVEPEEESVIDDEEMERLFREATRTAEQQDQESALQAVIHSPNTTRPRRILTLEEELQQREEAASNDRIYIDDTVATQENRRKAEMLVTLMERGIERCGSRTEFLKLWELIQEECEKSRHYWDAIVREEGGTERARYLDVADFLRLHTPVLDRVMTPEDVVQYGAWVFENLPKDEEIHIILVVMLIVKVGFDLNSRALREMEQVPKSKSEEEEREEKRKWLARLRVREGANDRVLSLREMRRKGEVEDFPVYVEAMDEERWARYSAGTGEGWRSNERNLGPSINQLEGKED